MAKFIEFATPRKNPVDLSSDSAKKIVKEHVDFLKHQAKKGKISYAGSTSDNVGGLIVYETETKKEARELINQDPLTVNNLMDISVHPFKTLDEI
ncbi:YciI family protein [Apilactobacillus kunkeei]|uniref:YciI family protein n=1 Tax=Apilactobacillus kunkeei TaxID=148814 RepID=UPI0006B259C2|nr:YciI family protein [Apilactobacillus kunkeei]